jgi:putative ABC transport system permease protein
MPNLRRFFARLLNAIDPRRNERELERELAVHRAMFEQGLIDRDLPADERRRLVHQRFGPADLIKEQHREARSFRLLDDTRQDLRYAVRMLRRSPVVSATAILSLALGIGANTVVFSVVDELLLKRLPVVRPDELVNVFEIWPAARPRSEAPTWEFVGLRDRADMVNISAIAIFDRSNVTLSTRDGTAVDVGRSRVGIVSGNYFSMLETQAAVGRALTPDDDRMRGGHPVAVVSDEFWARLLGRSNDVLSRTLTINRTPFTIVGVMPRGFTGDWLGRPIDLWFTTMMQGVVMVEAPDALIRPNDYWLRLVGRLRPGVTRVQAQAALQPIYQQVMREAAGAGAPANALRAISQQRLELGPGAAGFSPERSRLTPFLAALSLVAAVVLLVVCANVAGLLVSRGAAREREFAVRLAIGAGRLRLARQLLLEAATLAVIGGLSGLVLSLWGTRLLAALLAATPVQMFWAASSWLSFDIEFSWRTWLFTALVSLATGAAFGLVPVFRAGQVALADILAARSDVGARRSRFSVGKLLVASQAALTMIVLATTVLLSRSVFALRSQDLGFDRTNMLLVWLQPSSTGRSGAAMHQLWRDVQLRLAEIPGVASVAASNGAILSGEVPPTSSRAMGMHVQGQPLRTTTLPGGRTFIMPGFFKALGVPILKGREFTDRDGAAATPVVILNETMARFYFGGEDPIGRHVGFGPGPGTPVEVVGVVKDFERYSPHATGLRQMLTYFPYQTSSGGQLVIMCAAVRTAGDSQAVANPIRDALRRIDPSLAILKINTVDEQLEDVLAQDRLLAGLAGVASGVSALLACLGLYGIVSHMTTRRRSEIGVRIALGARARDVLLMFAFAGVRLALVGVIAGIPVALTITPLLIKPYLYGVGPHNPTIIGLAAVLIVAVSVVASVLPARRAARVDPVAALRDG